MEFGATTDPDQRWEPCSVPMCAPLRLFDFTDDNDDTPDAKGSLTHATVEQPDLPISFTVCSAFMVEFWVEKFQATVFGLMSRFNHWMFLVLNDADDAFKFSIRIGVHTFVAAKSRPAMFPLMAPDYAGLPSGVWLVATEGLVEKSIEGP